MVNAQNTKVQNINSAQIPASSHCYRHNHPFASRLDAHNVLSHWRESPNWVVPNGYADYSCVNPAPDGMFYIDVNISPNLHGGTGSNSYLMAATG